MADSERFMGRWSRLKREAREEQPAPPPPPEEQPEAGEPFDPSTLPPVESLDSDSDYTRFLAPEVPQEMRLLALRKAWVSDPKIADFRGFGEYDWDFNAPGYGQLLPTDNVREMVENMFREEPPKEPSKEVAVASAEPETPSSIPDENSEAATSLRHPREGGDPAQPDEPQGGPGSPPSRG